jgi:hypothetical protein
MEFRKCLTLFPKKIQQIPQEIPGNLTRHTAGDSGHISNGLPQAATDCGSG